MKKISYESLLAVSLLLGCDEEVPDSDCCEPEDAYLELGVQACSEERSSVVRPFLPDEESHRLLARFESPVDGVLCTVRYLLVGAFNPNEPDARCRSHLRHRVQVFASREPTPARDPTDVVEFVAEKAFREDGELYNERGRLNSFDTEDGGPILFLDEGDYIFVSIEMAADEGSTHLCVALCADGQPSPRETWWSQAREPPFSWTELDNFGLSGKPMVLLDIRPLQADGSAPFCALF
jgi:hypothetical protein